MKGLNELPAELRPYLEREAATQSAMPSAVRNRLWAQLSAEIAIPQPAPGNGSKLSRWAGGKVPVALVSSALGGAAGAAIHMALTRPTPVPQPAPVALALPAVAPAPNPTAAVAPAAELPAQPSPELPEPVAPHRPRHAAPVDQPAQPFADTLGAERTLLATARTALTRGDIASALSTLERHAQTYPAGALSEEREVLRVQALFAAGRRNEAIAAAHAFEARYPKSLSLPLVKASLEDSSPTR